MVELETNFVLISLKNNQIEYDLTKNASEHIVSDLSKVLFRRTGIHWDFIRIKGVSTDTIAARREDTKIVNERKIESNASVIEIKRVFPGAKIGKSTFH